MDFSPNVLILGTAALLGAIAVIGKILLGVFRFFARLDRVLPTLITIGEQFENNGGSTIKDKLDKLAIKADEQDAQDRIVLGIAEDSRLIAKTNAKIVEELTSTQTTELLHFREYLHEKMHEINNNLTRGIGAQMMTDQRVDRIERRLDVMYPLINRHREGDQ